MSFMVETINDNPHGVSWGPFATVEEAHAFVGTRDDLYIVDNSKVEGQPGRYLNLPRVGDRVTGICRSIGTRHTVTVVKVSAPVPYSGVGYTVHGVEDNGMTRLMGIETIEVIG